MFQIEMRDGEFFDGKSELEIVRAMKGATMFSDVATVDDYIDMLQRNAKYMENVDLIVKGNTTEEKAESLVHELVRKRLARLVESEDSNGKD